MFSVPDFLDRAKKAAGVDSDYALAVKVLGHKSQSRISNWRLEKATPDDDAVVALCALTGDDPGYVAVMLRAMRASNDDTAGLWRGIAKRLDGGYVDVALLMLVAIVWLAAYGAAAHSPDSVIASAMLTSVYYVKWIACLRLLWRLARIVRSGVLSLVLRAATA